MPDRPPPVRLNAPPRSKSSKSKPPRRARARKAHASGRESTLLYWIAGGLVFLLLVLIAICYETPEIKGWFATRQASPEKLAQTPAPAKSPVSSQPTAEEERRLKEKAAEETHLLEERTAPKPLLPPAPAAPPLVQPVPIGAIHGAPARALPLNPNKLDTERIAAYQVALERIHFSCGFIDGDQGMRTQRMLRAFQAGRGLPVTGFLDQPTRDAIGEPGEPFLTYTVTADDVASIMPKPASWIAKSKVARLGYNDIWEMLAEKFHCTRAYLKDLNRGVTTPSAGTEVIGPKVFPAAPIPKAASLRILLSETSLEALDANGEVIAFFPCSIAKDKNKRPHGLLTVKVVDPNPDYTFDPALFADAARAEGITHKMVLPPGPRNPVGTTWVGLSLPGYGIHGTPDPEAISRTQSHGCFRLANWNAEKVLKMVRVGTPVDVEP
jgi:lipoprotein-anchoring transpeptidase ErfK/SrfK